MIKMQVANDIPIFTPNGELTLWGVYKLHCEYMHENYDWDEESTKYGHDHRIRRIILYATPNHNITPIDQYPDSYPDDVRARMEARGNAKNGEPLKESTLEQYRYLAEVILETAMHHHLRQDNSGHEDQKSQQDKIHFSDSMRKAIRRFLHPQEELDLLKIIIPVLANSGPARLLLLMMACGFRENECAGFNWSMLEKDEESGVCTIIMPQTTQLDSNATKPGGKTSNAPRQIVVPSLVYHLLMKAKSRLLEKWMLTGGSNDTFENLPLGTRKGSLIQRCSTKDLTVYANEVFQKIGVREDELKALSEQLAREYYETKSRGLYADINDYRNGTCYMIRRNEGTAMAVLRIPTPHLNYNLGHSTLDAMDRRVFTSVQMQRYQHKRFSQRPLMNLLNQSSIPLGLGQTKRFCSEYAQTVIIPAGTSSATLDIYAKEPGDIVAMDINQCAASASELHASYHVSYADPLAEDEMCTPDINVLYYYHQLYASQIDEFATWIRQYL